MRKSICGRIGEPSTFINLLFVWFVVKFVTFPLTWCNVHVVNVECTKLLIYHLAFHRSFVCLYSIMHFLHYGICTNGLSLTWFLIV